MFSFTSIFVHTCSHTHVFEFFQKISKSIFTPEKRFEKDAILLNSNAIYVLPSNVTARREFDGSHTIFEIAPPILELKILIL